MKPCKATQDGKPCRNQADEGQEYCPFHLARQDADLKKNLSRGGLVATGLVAAAGIYKVAKPHLGKAATWVYQAVKLVVSKKL